MKQLRTPDLRVQTAQVAESLLNDYYKSAEFKALRQKHRKKEESAKAKKVHFASASIESFDTMVSSEASSPGSVYSRLTEKASYDDPPSTPGLMGVKGPVHKPPINVDDIHTINSVMHRVSFVSGSQPGKDVRRVDTPNDNIEKAQVFSALQLKSMNRDESIQSVISEVIAIHKELADDAHAIGVHRKELGLRVDSINKRYLKLFERVMSEILAMQRAKFTAIAEELEHMREAAEELLDKYLTEQAKRERAEGQILELTEQNKKLQSVIRAKDLEFKILEGKIAQLEDSEGDYMSTLEEMKRLREQEEQDRLALEAKLKGVEASTTERMMEELKIQLQREQGLRLEVEQRKQQALRDELLALQQKYQQLVATTTKFSSSESTQTEVDEYGLWDRSDGWLLPLSKTNEIRQRWRASARFASCPSCKGSGTFVVGVAALLRRMQRRQFGEEGDKKAKKEGRGNKRRVYYLLYLSYLQ